MSGCSAARSFRAALRRHAAAALFAEDEARVVRHGRVRRPRVLRAEQAADFDLHAAHRAASRNWRASRCRSSARISASPISTASAPMPRRALTSSGVRTPDSATKSLSGGISLRRRLRVLKVHGEILQVAVVHADHPRARGDWPIADFRRVVRLRERRDSQLVADRQIPAWRWYRWYPAARRSAVRRPRPCTFAS